MRQKLILLTSAIAFFCTSKGQAQWLTNENNIYNTNSGNVGIGTWKPGQKLDVSGYIRMYGADISEGENIIGYFSRGGNTTQGWNNTPDVMAISYMNRDFAIGGWAKNGTGWKGASFYINSNNGNIGIGTTDPKNKLDVAGFASLQGTVISEGGNIIGYISQGGSTTQGWNTSPDVLAISYMNRDFAIGGWAKNGTGWKGSSLYINSDNGNIGIGTITPGNYKLNVAGRIRADEIIVSSDGADFVFEPTYKLRSLSELETFIRTNKHLPDIAPAKEMQENGVSAGEMQAKLLQKVEELTLYVIEQQKTIELQNQRIKVLEQKINQ